MRIGRMLSAAMAMCVTAGCSGEGGNGGGDDAPAFLGNWSPGGSSGTYGQNLYHPWHSTVTEFLRLDEDGGQIVLVNYSLNARTRLPLTLQSLSDGFILHSEDLEDVRHFTVAADDDSLVLTDAEGESFEFWRNDMGNPSIENATVTTETPVLSSPIHPVSELVAQGTTAWFEIYGHMLVGADGTIAPMDAVYSHPIASQDGDFWVTCLPCDTPATLQRRTIGNALVSELDLGARVSNGTITSGYFDGASLWLSEDTTAANDLDPHTTLWRFDPETGEDIGYAYYTAAIETFTFHEGRMFAIVSMPTQVLLEIDTQQALAIRSMELPRETRWQGLASTGGQLRLLGAGVNEYPAIGTVQNL